MVDLNGKSPLVSNFVGNAISFDSCVGLDLEDVGGLRVGGDLGNYDLEQVFGW